MAFSSTDFGERLMEAKTDEYNYLVTANDLVSIKLKVFDIANSTKYCLV